MSPIPIRFLICTEEREKCTDPDCKRPDCYARLSRYATLAGVQVMELQPGDVFFALSHTGRWTCEWDNCDGRHLNCVLPEGKTKGYLHHWNIDGRASNCTLRQERTHRCWVRHGDPAIPGSLHVDKKGHTCQAGAGSILADGWHGFLHNGILHE